MQSLKTKYFPTSKKVEVVRQRCTIKNKIWSEIIYRVFIFEKLFGISLRGASNNALLGLIKPPAMRVVMTSAIDNSLIFDPLEESRRAGHVHDFQNDNGDKFESHTWRKSYPKEYLENLLGNIEHDEFEFEFEFEMEFKNRFVLSHKFKNRVSYFYYDDPKSQFYRVATRAFAYELGSNKLLAKAKMIEIAEHGIKLLETHYDENGEVMYEGLLFMSSLGFKKGETSIKGGKRKEYFFFWTTSMT